MSLQKITTENNNVVKNGVTPTGKTNIKTMAFSPLSHFKLKWLSLPHYSPTCANSEAIYKFLVLQQTNMITTVPDAAKSQHSIVHKPNLVQQKPSAGWHSSILTFNSFFHNFMINSWENLISKTWQRQGSRFSRLLPPFSLGCTLTWDSPQCSRTMVMMWALVIESRSLSKCLHFTLFWMQELVSVANDGVNPIQYSWRSRWDPEEECQGARAQVKLSTSICSHYGLGISRRAGTMLGNAPRYKSNLARVTNKAEDLNQDQRLYHKPSIQILSKKYFAFGKET